jgi:hypothetical protein
MIFVADESLAAKRLKAGTALQDGAATGGWAGTHKVASACSGASRTDNSGEREKLAIPMRTPEVEVNTGRIARTEHPLQQGVGQAL